MRQSFLTGSDANPPASGTSNVPAPVAGAHVSGPTGMHGDESVRAEGLAKKREVSVMRMEPRINSRSVIDHVPRPGQ